MKQDCSLTLDILLLEQSKATAVIMRPHREAMNLIQAVLISFGKLGDELHNQLNV